MFVNVAHTCGKLRFNSDSFTFFILLALDFCRLSAHEKNLKKTGQVHMGRFVGQVCEALDGRGGGRPDFAQGGGQLRDNLNEVLSQVSTWFDQHLQSR